MGSPRPQAIARPRIDPARVPFERTETFRRFGLRVVPSPEGEYPFMKALIREQGFDGPPQIMTPAELDLYVRTGEVELFRGVSAARHAEQLRTGDFYAGQGAMGGGIYDFGGPEGLQRATEYAQDPGSVVIRMALKAGARIADLHTIEAAMQRARDEAIARGLHRRPRWATILVETQVPSIYACYLGYDGMVDEQNDVWLIFNRTALRVQAGDIVP
jgi:hypothetical protein